MPRTLDDSVGDLLTSMGKVSRDTQGPAVFAIGTVTAGTQEGLRVQCNGNELSGEDLWINEALLEGYTPQLEGTIHSSYSGDGGYAIRVDREDLSRAQFALAAGDRVVLLTQDEQVYYLICKVVKLT